MKGRTVLAALTVAGLLAGSAAGAASATVISFRVAAAPANLGSTSDCPDGRTRTTILSHTRKRLGTSTICVLEASKTERPGFTIGSVTERVIERDAFRRGTIVSRATYVFRWITHDGSLAIVTVQGRVTSGTGRYAGAHGTISGTGFQRNGRQQLAFVVHLR